MNTTLQSDKSASVLGNSWVQPLPLNRVLDGAARIEQMEQAAWAVRRARTQPPHDKATKSDLALVVTNVGGKIRGNPKKAHMPTIKKEWMISYSIRTR